MVCDIRASLPGRGEMSEDKRRVTVIVPKEVHQSLKIAAVRKETSVSGIVRELLEDWLERQSLQPIPEDSRSLA